jgi:SAM-dependent methyltransferase
MIKIIDWHKKYIPCPLCKVNDNLVLGIRGNREYFGADHKTEPHIFTNVVQCKGCGFIYTNPMIFGIEHLERSHYNDPEKYQRDEEGKISKMFKERLKYISQFKKGKTLLDIGAGKGEFLYEALNGGWEVNGIEPSPEFCRFAKEKFGLKIINGVLGENDGFENQKFDLVTLNHVLEHVDDPLNLLKLILKYLNKDGILFIEVPNCGTLLLKIADLYFKLRGLSWSSRLSPLHPPFHKYGYTKKSLRFALEKVGYKVINIYTYSGSDRGYRKMKGISVFLRDLTSKIINLFGNRELLCVVAKPIE